MNETPPQFLASGADILVIGHDGKAHKARITEVLSPTGARVESLDGKNSAITEYSETKEVNTFHFPSSAKASAKGGTKSEA